MNHLGPTRECGDDGIRGLIAVLAITLIAVLSRFFLLSDAALVGDEVTSVWFASERADSAKNPAYYKLLLLAADVFGESEFSARLPAALFGIAAPLVFFFTWRNIIGRNAALFGAFLVVFSAWHLHLSQFARYYSAVFVFGSLTYYFFYQALAKDSLKLLAAAIAVGGIGVLFHVTTIVAFAACGAFSLLVYARPRAAQEHGLSRRVAKYYLFLCGLALLATAPFLWSVWENRQTRGVTWGGSPPKLALRIIRQVQLPVMVAAVFGLAMLLRQNRSMAVFSLLGVAIAVAFVLVAAAFMNSRSVYMFHALPLIFLLAAVACEHVRRRLAQESPWTGYVLVAVLAASMTPQFVSHYTGKASLDIREVIGFVADHYRTGDTVVSFVREFDYYSRNRIPLTRVQGHTKVEKNNPVGNLERLASSTECMWIIVKRTRRPLAKPLENWLSRNTRLAWRKAQVRYDYDFISYEVYLLDKAGCDDARP